MTARTDMKLNRYELVYIPKGRVTTVSVPFNAKNIQEARAYAWSQIELVNTYKNIKKKVKIKMPDKARFIAINVVVSRDGTISRNSGAIVYDGVNLTWMVHRQGKETIYDMRGDGKLIKKKRRN